eukprot:SAG31_NODE_450_length_15512_cov_5.788555_9_plen_218_part_00
MIPHIRFFADVRASTGESNHLEQDGELLEDSSYCQLWLGCHRVILHGKTAYFQALEAAAAKPGLETCLRPFTSLAGFDSTNRKSEVATRCRIQRLHLLGVLWPQVNAQVCSASHDGERNMLTVPYGTFAQTVAFHAVKAAMARRIISADNNPKPDKHGLVPGFIHLLPTLVKADRVISSPRGIELIYACCVQHLGCLRRTRKSDCSCGVELDGKARF